MVMSVADARNAWLRLSDRTPVAERHDRAADLTEALLHDGAWAEAAEFADRYLDGAGALGSPATSDADIVALAHSRSWCAVAFFAAGLTSGPAQAQHHIDRARQVAAESSNIDVSFLGRQLHQLDVMESVALLTRVPAMRTPSEILMSYDEVMIRTGDRHPVLGYLALETLCTMGYRHDARVVARDEREDWQQIWTAPDHPIRQRYELLADGPDFGVTLPNTFEAPRTTRPSVRPKTTRRAATPLLHRYQRAIDAMESALASGDNSGALQAATEAPDPLPIGHEGAALSRECATWTLLSQIAVVFGEEPTEESRFTLQHLQAELDLLHPTFDDAPPVATAVGALTSIALSSTLEEAREIWEMFTREEDQRALREHPFLRVLSIEALEVAGYVSLARDTVRNNMGFYEIIWPEMTHPMRNRLAMIGTRRTNRTALPAATDSHAAVVPSAREELDTLIGLDGVKDHLSRLEASLRTQQLRAEHGLQSMDVGGHHLVFTGNPGTGKTTVARLIGRLYHELGLLEKGHVVELGRAGLTGQYIGHTEQKTKQALESALGGVLFIDEAYSLNPGDSSRDFGSRAIDEIVQFASAHKGELVIILAGYPQEMHQLLDVNPGLRSRFSRTFGFDDYTTHELIDVVLAAAAENDYALSDDGLAALRATLDDMPRDRNFGNARDALDIFARSIEAHGARIIELDGPTVDDLRTLTAADIPSAHELAVGSKAPAPTRAEPDTAHGMYI